MDLEKQIRHRFNKACKDYKLLAENDRILIALSGGKDSLMLCRLMAMRARIFVPKIHIEAAHVLMDNIPYETDRGYLKQFCDDLGITLHILHSQFEESAGNDKTKCFLCSWNRRKTLFQFACEHGFNKVALGHHQDDILTTWLMNIVYEGNIGSMRPKLSLKHYTLYNNYTSESKINLEIIRPLCLTEEQWIADFAEQQNFTKLKTPCPYEIVTKRKTMNDLFHQIIDTNKEARYSMWRAMMMATGRI